MYKLLIVSCLAAAAAAAPAPGLVGPAVYGGVGGVVGAPWGLGGGVYGSPLLGAPVVKAAVPVATSYANTVRVASPVAYAAPAVHAPLVASPWAGGLAAPWGAPALAAPWGGHGLAAPWGAPALAHGW